MVSRTHPPSLAIELYRYRGVRMTRALRPRLPPRSVGFGKEVILQTVRERSPAFGECPKPDATDLALLPHPQCPGSVTLGHERKPNSNRLRMLQTTKHQASHTYQPVGHRLDPSAELLKPPLRRRIRLHLMHRNNRPSLRCCLFLDRALADQACDQPRRLQERLLRMLADCHVGQQLVDPLPCLRRWR